MDPASSGSELEVFAANKARRSKQQSYSRDEPRNIDRSVHRIYALRNACCDRPNRCVANGFMTNMKIKNAEMHLLQGADVSLLEPHQGTRLRVENIHYELTEKELEFNLCYDRAGRSEGVAFVTYQHRDDATTAIQEFDGANANGKGSRHPSFATSCQARSLADRITAPDDRDRPGARRDNPRDSPRDQEGRGGQRSGTRTRKTQEELDAEMDDYFTGGQAAQPAAAAAPNDEHHDDIDMIE
ncbi:unnamed protein product [Parascedosporium putredinis]|uniref:RRM domain-containing protein n=1 Tax=Parascedosporium putredinis TaxID=1442378 RepID=A0A9P1H5V2_9PEZI|nr:unnamed protein product [Parascedosporium putredinis]CAI7998269.1 unnamed protein product [Parascedosporium putredinis]